MVRNIFENAPLRMNPAKILCSNKLRFISGFLLLFSLVTNRQKNKNVVAAIQIEVEDKIKTLDEILSFNLADFQENKTVQ